MNAAQHHNQLPRENAGALANGQGDDLALSAMVDGEISASELDALLTSLEEPVETLSNWHAYQVIGDVLRGHEDPTGSTSASDFLAAVRIGLQAQETAQDAAPRAIAQTVGVRAVKGPDEAANDAVFRWKLVASFASIAAVMAVSWGVIAGSGIGPAGTHATGAELALTAPGAVSAPAVSSPAAVAAVAVPALTSPVVVSTGQGLLIRDAQLEALLAEHRQHGGMSALQMPSGFIRNATYDAAGR